jgi:molybdenum cofactor cytidylyltransferase
MSKKVAGIILAAGSSSRFGAIKQLLPWKRTNLVNTVIETATLAGLDPMIVVLGSNADQIRASLDESLAQIVINPDWETGQSTSLKAGLKAIKTEVCGAIFLLADQPHLSVNLVAAVAEEGIRTEKVVIPVINDRRANPVYFPASCFYLFKGLNGDVGGRQIVSECPHTTIPWLDEWMAKDVDTPENYEELSEHFWKESDFPLLFRSE